ncbi:MAG: hypothetical protein KAU22_00855, partial [Desulfuromonadales bacterium]|nr:hypothetical protein [Desulfuromonadales bacterium]
ALTLTVAHRVRAPAWNQVATIVLPFVLCGAAWATTNRNIVWQDNLTLYQDAVEKSPNFAPAINQLAIALKAHNRHDEASKLLVKNQMPVGDVASLNVAAALWDQGDYTAARSYLLQRLVDNPGAQETRILEMLVKMTSEYLNETDDNTLKRNGYKDILVWLERITEISSTGFNYYRIGRIHLVLEDKVAAQKAFAEAVKLFPADSMYKEPATKLARDLAR